MTKSEVFAPVPNTDFLVGGSGGVCPFPAALNVPLYSLHADSSDAPALSPGSLVPPPLLVKGLNLAPGLWEWRGEDSLTALYCQPGPRMGHALLLRVGAQSHKRMVAVIGAASG